MSDDPKPPDSDRVARRLRSAGLTGAAVLVLVALGWLALRLVALLSAVVIPLAVALLLAALLHPLVVRLHRAGLPQWSAVALVVVGALALLGGLLTFAVNSLLRELPALQDAIESSVAGVRDWLVNGPLQLSRRQLEQGVDDLTDWLRGNAESLASGAGTTASAAGRFLAGSVLALFVLIFLLHDGHRIWSGLVRRVPRDLGARVDASGRHAFARLSGYTRATVAVALLDAVGIGIGLLLVGVPFALPLTSLVFLGGFIPFVGAFVSGAAAVLIALFTNGPVAALIIAAVVIVVQQLEGNVLQPLLLGKAVRLHPLTVVLAVAVGGVLAGITGALFAVPAVLVAKSFLTEPEPEPEPETEPEPEPGHADTP
ncbi:AI-2E family transporter [Saccharothrix algeriensis]|uniref:PurR-regulated permease PerM n=3 Tax=Saccharothrix algeriensis TaxID=173560 RepID=A0ABS2SE81_9PSEU|nr:AI-2E family transporter [Saccharothrix algeriensis]MBM7814576.1 putative PurR-regulated permease PerM [Saccharothrix algeriensis]